MKNLFNYLNRQLAQPSTWRGITVVATAAGVGIIPEAINLICTAGAAIFGLIEIFRNEHQSS